jgi:hypothetical protein
LTGFVTWRAESGAEHAMDRKLGPLLDSAAGPVCLGLLAFMATGWHRALRPLVAILEAVLILSAFAILLRHAPVVGAFRAASARYRVFALTVLGVFLVGHLADANTFPLVQWGMYSRVHDDDNPSYEEYVATFASGTQREFHPAGLFPGLRNARIMRNLQLHVKALRQEDDPERRARRRGIYHATLAALVRIHNRRHPDDPIVGLKAFSATLPIHPYRGQDAVERTFLWELDLGAREVR